MIQVAFVKLHGWIAWFAWRVRKHVVLHIFISVEGFWVFCSSFYLLSLSERGVFGLSGNVQISKIVIMSLCSLKPCLQMSDGIENLNLIGIDMIR